MSEKKFYPQFKGFETIVKSTVRGRMGSKMSKTSSFYPSYIYEKFLKKCLKSKKTVLFP